MKTVAVLGGGPAGAFAAERLASAGLKTICSTKSWRGKSPAAAASPTRRITQYPFLIENDTPKKIRHRDDAGRAARRRSEDAAGRVRW